MRHLSLNAFAILSVVLALPVAHAQTPVNPRTTGTTDTSSPMAMADMHHQAATPSTTLTVIGLNGETRTFTPAELRAMPHTTVMVTNGHTNQPETYTGVPVHDILALLASSKPASPEAPTKPKSIPNLTILLAEATDHYRVAFTLCDTNPACRSGQTIVADTENNQPLTTEGAFKLILSEDKMPSRWVRNLTTLTEKNLAGF